jgi:MYXO-CTERM domain-containing protein
MPRVAALTLLSGIALVSRPVLAGDDYTCCDLAARPSGSCVAQSTACSSSTGFAVGISTLSAATAGGDWVDSGLLSVLPTYEPDGAAGPSLSAVSATFPAGVNGYMTTTVSPPWTGLCVDAPSSTDPAHQSPTEPIGCIAISLAPGISGQLATFQFPVSSRWDAYQLCYGASSSSSPDAGGTSCENVNDSDDPSVTPTPGSASCCSPPHVLTALDAISATEWSVTVSQEIPGVPPPVILLGPDGGLTLFYNPDAGVSLAAAPSACLSAYGEPSSCGQPPMPSDAGLTASVAGCVPTTCAAQGASCAVIADGCGGTLNCADGCSTKGSLSCAAATPGEPAELSYRFGGLGAAIALAATAWRRRGRKRRA